MHAPDKQLGVIEYQVIPGKRRGSSVHLIAELQHDYLLSGFQAILPFRACRLPPVSTHF
jgi:hypothetical protein